MKERPILFSGPMVRAILVGRKTMTRRVIKNQDVCRFLEPPYMKQINELYEDIIINQCPYGSAVSQDRVWVRETWKPDNTFKGGGIPRLGITWGEGCIWKEGYCDQYGPWKPSIFMPRWASRITLEITNVKVERLNSITAHDVEKEGVDVVSHLPAFPNCPKDEIGDLVEHIAQQQFQKLWDSINGKKYTWASNPWVWVISFRRLVA